MDDRLRALERAARSNPGDREATWAWVRALEQSGDVGAAWSERCRLMRAGDEEAWNELSTAPRGATSLEAGAARTFPRGVEVCGDGRTVFVGDATTVHALDARSLETSWSVAADGPEPGAMWGPHLVHVGPEGSTLLVRGRADGVQVGSVALPHRTRIGAVLATPGHLVAVWDRQEDDRPDELFVVDLADGAVAGARVREWPEARGFVWPIAARDVLLQSTTGGSTIAYDLASTRVRWSHQGAPVRADARDAVLHVRGPANHQLSCVDLGTGRLRWVHHVEGAAAVAHALGPELVIVAKALASPPRGKRTNLDVDAVDRTSGELRWSLRDLVGPHVLADVAAGQGVVYVAYGRPWVEDDPTRGLDDLTILCLDARTGERIGAPCGVTGPAERPILRTTLLPVDGAVVVVVRGHYGTWLGRVGEP